MLVTSALLVIIVCCIFALNLDQSSPLSSSSSALSNFASTCSQTSSLGHSPVIYGSSTRISMVQLWFFQVFYGKSEKGQNPKLTSSIFPWYLNCLINPSEASSNRFQLIFASLLNDSSFPCTLSTPLGASRTIEMIKSIGTTCNTIVSRL